uniref:Uncharacterized protein n=1 Tax=Panagrolaimus davidi TaxID=227884 RepID=A0A914QE65_9BILA
MFYNNAKHQQAYRDRTKLKPKRTLASADPKKRAAVVPGTTEERLLNQGIVISLQDAIVELVTHGGSAEQKRQADLTA